MYFLPNEMKVSNEVLRSLDPVFKSKIRIFAKTAVNKIRSNGKQRHCCFVVSAAGIHLIRRKQLRYKVSCAISYFELSSIFVSEQKGRFGTHERCIRVVHENMREIAMLVYSIRVAIVPVARRKLDVSFDVEIPWCSPYDPREVVRDRLASVLVILRRHIPLDLLLAAMPYRDHVFHVRENQLESEARLAVYLAMSVNEDLSTLSFESVVFRELFPDVGHLLRNVRDIRRVVFAGVDFKGSTEPFLMTMQAGHMFFPEEIIFRQVVFEDSEFFSVLEFLGHKPQSLEFDRCTFHGNSLETIAAFLNKQLFWKDLKRFSVVEMPGASFTTKLNMVELPVLESVSVDGSEIDVSQLLEAPCINSIHMKSMRFSHGTFAKPLVSLPPLVRNIETLDFSDTRFSKEGLLSVFSWVSKLTEVGELKLSNISIEPMDLNCVLKAVAKMEMCVKSLMFDGNLMNCEQTKLFSAVIANQRSLVHLSIGDSIDISDTVDGLSCLFATLGASSLTSISFASHRPERRLGSELVPFLAALIDINRIKELDVENQPLGEDGIKLLIRLIKDTGLERLSFDGIDVPSLDYLLGLCNAAVSSEMKSATWPTREFERLVPAAKEFAATSVLSTTIDVLKTEFLKEFSGDEDTGKHVDKTTEDLASDIPDFDVSVITRRNPDLETLFEECTEGTEDQLVPILLEFSETLSLDSLCLRLQNAQ